MTGQVTTPIPAGTPRQEAEGREGADTGHRKAMPPASLLLLQTTFGPVSGHYIQIHFTQKPTSSGLEE